MKSLIEINDLRREFRTIRSEVLPRMTAVVANGAFLGGEELTTFEKQFARYCGARFAVGVGSGTAALHLSLLALGIGPGDEVLTTALSFNATAEAIAHTGATPVFVDVIPGTYGIDPAAVARAITPKTKAILPVHLYGIPADMRKLRVIAKRHRVAIVEDCAQAHGSRIGKKHVGTFGELGCFSFMAAKNIGAYGDGGMVITNSALLAGKLRMLRDHGRREKYRHEILGYCERLDNLQAAVLNVKLRHLTAWNRARAKTAHTYRRAFEASSVMLTEISREWTSSHYVFPIFVQQRENVQATLLAAGIRTGVYYPIPLHLQPVFRHLGYTAGAFPVAEEACRTVLALPMHPFLRPHEIRRVIAAVQRYATTS